ncbi:MAG: hypothetical protein WBF93_10890 [Pirellulales bacterium]
MSIIPAFNKRELSLLVAATEPNSVARLRSLPDGDSTTVDAMVGRRPVSVRP